jgi:hypothetical protein
MVSGEGRERMATQSSGWQMALVIFAITYLVAGGILLIVMALAKGERATAFKTVSLGLLSPLGIIFGLMVVFSVSEVWSEFDRAKLAVDREASAIRMVELLAASFPGEPEAQIRSLIRRHIDEAVSAYDGETICILEGCCTGAVRGIAADPCSGTQERRADRGATGNHNGTRKCNGCAPPAHCPQPVERELGQVELPFCAGRLYPGRDRRCSL